MAACQPGRAAGTTGTGSAAHRGAHAGDVRARPVSRRSCAAAGGPVGGCAHSRESSKEILAAVGTPVVDVPVIMQPAFLQSVLVPEVQLLDRMLDIQVMLQ